MFDVKAKKNILKTLYLEGTIKIRIIHMSDNIEKTVIN